ncbi:hypothetical protein Tco_0905043 [Tanacetum coccineum]
MSAITDIRYVLTQKALDSFSDKFHIPKEVHLVLSNQNDTMHERPAGKIGLSKVSHFEILCRVYGIVPTVGLFRCFYVNSKKSGWMSFNDFACPASFSWHTAKHVTRDPDPVAADFNAQDYATLVAHPSLFQKFLEAFLYLVGLSRYYTLDEETYPLFLHKNREEINIFAFIHTPNPTKVRVVKREQNEDDPRLLDTTVGRTVSLLPVAPDRAESKHTVVEVVAPVQPRRQGKRKSVVMDAGEASHPPKKRREDHGAPSGTFVGGKSRSTIKRLLAEVVLNAEVGVAAIPTLPFVAASVSSTPEREAGDHTDSVAEPNLRTIVDSLVRSSAPIMTTVTTDTSTVDPAFVVKEKPVKPSLFSADSSSAGGADPNTGVFSDLTGSDFLVGGIRTVIDPDTDLQKVYVPQWSVTNGSRLDDGRVCREMVDEFAPPSAEVRMRVEYNVKERRRLKSVVEKQDELLKTRDGEIEDLKAQLLLKETEAAEATRLRAQTSNLEAIEKSLQDEVNALKERNTILEKERNALDVKVMDLEALVVGKERDLTDLNAQLTSVKSQNDTLVDRVHELERSSSRLQEKITVYDNCIEQLEKFQDDRMKVVNDKLAKLDADLAEMACHLEERFYPYLLNTISGRRWLLTYGLKLFLVKCLNSFEYLTALGASISHAIKRGMQISLEDGIDHGREGRSLADVAAYNPDAVADFNSALQKFREVDFPLLVELKSHKDSSMEDIMNVLRLEGALADAPGMDDLQPDIDVLHSRVERIRENIAAQRSALVGVWTPLLEPLSITSLMGEASTSGVVPAASMTATVLSTTFASASSIPPISTDDFEIVGVDGQKGAGTDGQVVADGNISPFPNVDDVELNIPQ